MSFLVDRAKGSPEATNAYGLPPSALSLSEHIRTEVGPKNQGHNQKFSAEIFTAILFIIVKNWK